MACTLLATPSLGASDWTNFITQVEYQRRGFMAVTYTNFSGSAESAIAAGSFIEIAGATYQFTETAIDYTGGGSTASDLYIYVKPDAVISTASVVAWGSAPVWVDAKQGFYASAASVTRCIGGMYVGSTATYYNKYLYTGESLNYCLQNNKTRPLLKKTADIGEWNMDSTLVVYIAHGLTVSKIRSLRATIRGDGGGTYGDGVYDLAVGGPTDDINGQIYVRHDDTTLLALRRKLGGFFDTTDFDGTVSTIANRGWIHIIYEA